MKILHKIFGKRTASDPKISLSENEFILLDIINSHSSTGICTADIQTELENITRKTWRLATLYGISTELQSKGLIEVSGVSPPENGGRPRNLFTLTASGKTAQRLGEQIVSVGTRSDPLPA